MISWNSSMSFPLIDGDDDDDEAGEEEEALVEGRFLEALAVDDDKVGVMVDGRMQVAIV